jgi:hypothetical protein
MSSLRTLKIAQDYDPGASAAQTSTSSSGATTTQQTNTAAGGSIQTTQSTFTYVPPTTTQTPVTVTSTVTNILGTYGITISSNNTDNNGSSIILGGSEAGVVIHTKGNLTTNYVDFKSNMFAPSLLCTSDERLKTDITLLDNALDKVNKLKGVTYTWKDGHGRKEIGVIAQDIHAQFPELVTLNSDNFLTVDYPKLTAVLIESVKDLKKEIDTIKESLNIKNPCQIKEKKPRKPRQPKKLTE